jgi:hypothetical protein
MARERRVEYAYGYKLLNGESLINYFIFRQ